MVMNISSFIVLLVSMILTCRSQTPMPCFLIEIGNSTDADYLMVGTNASLEGTLQNLDNVTYITTTCKLNSNGNNVNIVDNGKYMYFTAIPGTMHLHCFVSCCIISSECTGDQIYTYDFHYNWTGTVTYEPQATKVPILPSPSVTLLYTTNSEFTPQTRIPFSSTSKMIQVYPTNSVIQSPKKNPNSHIIAIAVVSPVLAIILIIILIIIIVVVLVKCHKRCKKSNHT